MEDGAIPATVAIPNGYVRLDPRDILKETDLVFVCQPGRAPIFRPTISAGCMAGEDMIYIRRLRAPASPPKPEGRDAHLEQAWAEIRDVFADTMLNMAQRKAFVISILKGQLANPPKFGGYNGG